MSDQEKKVSECIPQNEREAINFGRGGYYAPEGTAENLAKLQNASAGSYHSSRGPEVQDKDKSEGFAPDVKEWTNKIPYVDNAIAIADTCPQPKADIDSSIENIDQSSLQESDRDYFKEWTIQTEVVGATEIGEGVTEMAQRILDETGLSPAELIANSSVTDSLSMPNQEMLDLMAQHPPIPAEKVEQVLDHPVVLGQVESMTITRGVEVPEPGEIDNAFDPENPEHMEMLNAALEKGEIFDAHVVMEKPTMIEMENVRNTVVPIPTELIREYFTNKGIFYMVDYQQSRLKGTAFLTYLTNLNVPSDICFGSVMQYEEYSELMKAYMDQRSIVGCSLLHVMAAELLLFAKGLPIHRSPYMSPVPNPLYLERFIEENKEQVDRWLHFIDSTQVFALSAIKVLNAHYKPKEFFEIIDDKEYVGSNIAQLYRIPEFIAYYFAIEGAEFKMSYFQQQYEEYMFKNERLAKYFRSPHNFAALMFEHIAQGTITAADIGYGMFIAGAFDPASGIPQFDATAPAPE